MRSKAPPRQTGKHSQETQPRRGLGSWIRRGFVWLVAGLLALAVIGAIYQAIATQIDQRTYSPPGEMVDVGTHSLHINCLGEGGPTVILEAANFGMSTHWVRVQQQLAKTTRVCAYDRAGLGWSERGTEARYPNQVSGVVLVDSSPPEQFTRSPQGRAMYEQTRRIGAVLPWLTRLGVI